MAKSPTQSLRRASQNKPSPMTHEQRRALIETPIIIQVVGKRSWGGARTVPPVVRWDGPSDYYEQQYTEMLEREDS